MLLLVDGKTVLRIEPEGLAQLADWLEDNASMLRAEQAWGEGVNENTQE